MATCNFSGAADSLWDTAGNWDNVPADGDDVVMDAGVAVGPCTVGPAAPISLVSLTLTNNFTLNDSNCQNITTVTLTTDGGAIGNAAGQLHVTGNANVAGDVRNLTVDGTLTANSIAVNGCIAANVSFTTGTWIGGSIGGGTLTECAIISGDTVFTGNIILDGGLVQGSADFSGVTSLTLPGVGVMDDRGFVAAGASSGIDLSGAPIIKEADTQWSINQHSAAGGGITTAGAAITGDPAGVIVCLNCSIPGETDFAVVASSTAKAFKAAGVATGSTVYAIARQPGTANPWNAAAYETWDDSHLATYAVALNEQGTSGCFFADSDPGMGNDIDAVYYLQSGGSPALSDTEIGSETLHLNGVAVGSIAAGAIDSTAAPALANLDAAVSTRSTFDGDLSGVATPTNVSDGTAAVIAALPNDPDNAGIAAIQAKTDNLPAAPSEFDASTDKVIPVDADGVAYAKAMQALLAVCLGKAAISGSSVSFKARDGTTEVVNVTVGATIGQRTASTIT